MRKSVKFLLSACSLMSLVSCGSATSDEVLRPFDESNAHLQTGTLHEVDVQDGDIVLADNGNTDFLILYEKDNVNAQKAAGVISSHLSSATGANPKTQAITGEEVYSPSVHWIVLNGEKVRQAAGISDTNKAIGVSGYQIDTKDSSCFIHVNGELGYQQGALAFLRYALGYSRYSSNVTTYTKVSGKKVNLPKMKVVEKPDFSFHTQSNKVDNATSYEMGFLTSGETFYNDSEIQTFHNSFDWLPKTTYQKDHPKWYATSDDQICYTARGDETEYEAMVETTAARMIEKLKTNSSVGALTFSIQDNYNSCKCEACLADVAKYGAASGSVVKFLNDVDDIVQDDLQKQAEESGKAKREVDLCFFAYHTTEKPCVKKDSNGNYVPTSEDVVCNEHVGPYIAPIGARYSKTFYDEANESYANSIKGWGALSKRLYLWVYETNFSHYLYPLNSYTATLETYRFLYENNALYAYNEGQHNQGATTAFGRFKEYFNSIAMFDVNCSYNQIVDDFFANYFRDAKEVMLKYFYELQDQLSYIEETYPTDVNGTIYNNIAQSRFWPKKLLDRWVGYIDEGIEAIAPLAKSNQSLYQTIYDNLTLESVFPRYALLEHYSGTYSSSELQSARSSFRSDCQRLNVTMSSENSPLENTYTSWGF